MNLKTGFLPADGASTPDMMGLQALLLALARVLMALVSGHAQETTRHHAVQSTV